MTVHLEWQSPYPRRRHVRPPDPISAAEWLREIGVTTGRRRTDGQPLLVRGDGPRPVQGASGCAWRRPDGRVRTRRLASVGGLPVLPVTLLNAWFVLLAVVLLVLFAVTVWALLRSRRLRDQRDIATEGERYQRGRADRFEEDLRRSLRPSTRHDATADDPADDLLGLGDPPPEDGLATFTAHMGALTERIGRLTDVTEAFADVTEVPGRHHEGRS